MLERFNRDNDGHLMIKSDESLTNHKMACGKGMVYLRDRKLAEAPKLHKANQGNGPGHGDLDFALGDVYQCLSNMTPQRTIGSKQLSQRALGKTQSSVNGGHRNLAPKLSKSLSWLLMKLEGMLI